jgi:hypothetical protein
VSKPGSRPEKQSDGGGSEAGLEVGFRSRLKAFLYCILGSRLRADKETDEDLLKSRFMWGKRLAQLKMWTIC